MNKIISLLFAFIVLSASAQDYNKYFLDKTLRVDYIFSGNAKCHEINLDKLASYPTWAGRTHNLSKMPLQGNGQIIMTDAISGDTIYCTSFSSLFSEWLDMEEAQTTRRAYENTFLLPFPKDSANITVTLLDKRHQVSSKFSHQVVPSDILIEAKGLSEITPHKYIHKSGSPSECIDVAILAEGYTIAEMDSFYHHAATAVSSIFAHEPFASMKDKFNFVAVASPSKDSGVSIPRLNDWKDTAFSSHFSTFYSDRYLTTRNVKDIHDALAGIAYEHIIILANTNEYGGGGIYNSYTLTTARHPMFKPVVVHEFGHSFGGLGDEYFYENDVMTGIYPLDIEPWEQNITTRIDLSSKWADMLPTNIPIPTSPADADKYPTGVYEGGGYSTYGIYRPADICRMRNNTAKDFCPVCQRALTRLINFYTTKSK